MKKILTAITLATAGVSFAADFGVNAVRDYAVDRNGTQFTASVAGVGASFTRVDNTYDRFGVSKTFDVYSFGPVKVGATVGGVYQNTAGTGANGYGLTAGVQATYPVTKNVDLVAGVGRFIGQSRIDQFNGTNATAGFKVKF